MARSQIDEQVRDAVTNLAIDGAKLYVYTHGTTTVVPLYTTEAGGVSAPNPMTSVYGTFTGAWVDDGQYDFYFVDGQVPARFDPVTRVRGMFAGHDLPQTLLEPLMRIASIVIPIGMPLPWPGSALPAGGFWDWADGGLINRLTYPNFYAVVGHKYNGGLDPGSNMVRKPDKRGRTIVGSDNMGTAQGAAGRLLSTSGHPSTVGASGGVETVLLTGAESGTNGSGQTDPGGVWQHDNVLRSAGAGHWAYAQSDSTLGPDIQVGTINSAAHVHDLNSRPADTAHKNVQPYEAENFIVRIQ